MCSSRSVHYETHTLPSISFVLHDIDVFDQPGFPVAKVELVKNWSSHPHNRELLADEYKFLYANWTAECLKHGTIVPLEVRKKCYRLSDGKRSRLREKNEEHTDADGHARKKTRKMLYILFRLFVASILCPKLDAYHLHFHLFCCGTSRWEQICPLSKMDHLTRRGTVENCFHCPPNDMQQCVGLGANAVIASFCISLADHFWTVRLGCIHKCARHSIKNCGKKSDTHVLD